ncbi:hypothetical protein Nepgr_017786 [Nepenthes gracilis]|uniref:Acyl-[acyl-carrier-protein] hydrolase n=1 Tax=Nepenthes gracilis TaxID=150966 RepID=A0AAD3XTQ4_NEPGR|nr:hypothetical protein Nepgr_017786 [Nepenthes gracilis]
MGASLPPKEANLFKLIVKSYETKQYKKGLKAADAILKKFPDHGETLSMKGLTLNCMDRKAEAYELVRLGLKNDLKSHVCWHVYGLLYRSDREYREAIKCYRNALKIDPDNIEILRDLSLLQAQMRDLTGFVETRQQLLTLKPNHRMNWIGFAVAQHLNSNASKAIEILGAYEGTLEDDYPPDNECCEHSEMLLYKVSLLEECGFIQSALEELHKKEMKIVDKLSYKEQEVSLLLRLNRFEEAEKLYRALLLMNPDNYRYYEGLQKCLGLYADNGKYSSDDIEQLDYLYKSLGKQYTWSTAVKRIPLDFLQGEKFQEATDNYIRPFLTKGVPSLFSDLSPLYDQSGKADILEKLMLELEHSIRKTGAYPGRVEKEPPSTLLWILFLLAQHYDRRGQYDIALAKIDEAIEHTPTVIDLYSVKSRILKHAGDLTAAAALADEARCMDLADRYINSECVKRMLQADQVSLAEKTAVLFTKDGDQHNNLHDMQCMWYELASGESYFRQGDLGRALKKFLAVEKHYADITEDQFDFHSYCLRKMTLRTYVEMLKFQDRLHSHAYFHKAASGAIRCYIKLFDSPPKSATDDDDEMAKLLPSQKKKMRQKQRKAEARAKKEAESKNEETSATNLSKSGKRHIKAVDPDPHGEKLLQVGDPLMEATKYLKLLQKNSLDSLETHLLSFEVNMRKQKILLALQAVKHLIRLDAESPDSHCCLIRFFKTVSSMPAPQTNAEQLIWSVLEAERASISQLHEKSLTEVNMLFLKKHEDSLMHRAAVAEMLYLLESNKKAEAIKLIEDSSNNTVSTNGALGPIGEWRLKDCIAVHRLLDGIFLDQDAASRWKIRCAKYFPHSTYFEGKRSSSVSSTYLNLLCQNPENGAGNPHEDTQPSGSVAMNGKLEAFKDLKLYYNVGIKSLNAVLPKTWRMGSDLDLMLMASNFMKDGFESQLFFISISSGISASQAETIMAVACDVSACSTLLSSSPLHPRCSTRGLGRDETKQGMTASLVKLSNTNGFFYGFRLRLSSSFGSFTVKANAEEPRKINGISLDLTSKTETVKNGHGMLPVQVSNKINQLPDSNLTIELSEEGRMLGKRSPIVHFSRGGTAEDEPIFRQNFFIRSYEIDCNQKASFEALMNYSQEANLNHLKNSGLMVSGFGVTSEMNKRNLIWVFSKMQAAVDCYPSWGDNVQADTWFSSMKNCLRCDFLLSNGKTGKTLMRASSFGVMINKHTRKLSKFIDTARVEMEPILRICDPIIDEHLRKLQKLEEDKANYIRKGLTPQWSDLDVNQHVNNVKFISWILEGTPASVRETHELSEIAVEYRKECQIDSKVESLSAISDDGSGRYKLDHLLRLESGTEISRARTTWRPMGNKSAFACGYIN